MAVNLDRIPTSHQPDRNGSIRAVLANYPKISCIISEFIQNAEDEKAKRVIFTITPTEVVIENDGNPFNNTDYRRLAEFASGKFGQSHKIGKFGIGFLSAFHITDLPTVVSNGARVTILEDGSIDKEKDHTSADRKGAKFVLPVRATSSRFARDIGVKPVDHSRLENLAQELPPAFGRNLLFLEHVRLIEGWKENNGRRSLLCRATRTVRHQESFLANSLKVVHRKVTVSIVDKTPRDGHRQEHHTRYEWHIFSCEFRREYMKLFNSKPPYRTTVAIAFCLGDIEPEALGQLYAYLPTKIATGFRFNMNAHFAPRTGRDDIRDEQDTDEGQWNHWLIACLARLSGAIGERLTKLIARPRQLYDIIPMSHSPDRKYLEGITSGFIQGVEDKRVIYSSRHGWVSKQHGVQQISGELRKIVEESDVKLVHRDVQKHSQGAELIKQLAIPWYRTEDLVESLSHIPSGTKLVRAPRFVNTKTKVSRLYDYLGRQNLTDESKAKLQRVCLCPDQHGNLHAFQDDNDRVYWVDVEMRRLLSQEDIPIVDASLWSKHQHVLRRLVRRFGAEELVEYLDTKKDQCTGVPMRKCSVKMLRSVSRVGSIWTYLEKHKIFTESRWAKNSQRALDGTPLCISDDGLVFPFSIETRFAYRADKRTRVIMVGSSIRFVHKNLQYKHRRFLEEAVVPIFGTHEVVDYLATHLQEGRLLSESDSVVNSEHKLKSVALYLARAKLTKEDLIKLRNVSAFLTMRGVLRPLLGSKEGPLFIETGVIDDPLGLDCALNSEIYSDHRLRRWIREVLTVPELTIGLYVKDHLLPQYGTCDDATKLALLSVLKGNLTILKQDESIVKALQNADLIRAQKGYAPGYVLCHRSPRVDRTFPWFYRRPHDFYGFGVGDSSKPSRWETLFNWLGVRKLPHPVDIISAAHTLCSDKNRHLKARRLLRFLNDNWTQYQEESAELTTLCEMQWLPAQGNDSDLFKSSDLWLPELRRLAESQVIFLDFRGLRPELCSFLGIHDDVDTATIVNHLLWLVENGHAARTDLYRALDERSADTSLDRLKFVPCIHMGSGDYWTPSTVFLEPVERILSNYLRQVPKNIRDCVRLLRRIGVKDRPQTDDYASVLPKVAKEYANQQLDVETQSAVVTVYGLIAKGVNDLDNSLADDLRTLSVVLGNDGYLHEPGSVFIEDLRDWDQMGFDPDPVFATPEEYESLYMILSVKRLSRVISRRPTSIQGEALDEAMTDKMNRVWSVGIMRFQLTLKNEQIDLESLREKLESVQVEMSQSIKVRYGYSTTTGDVNGKEVEADALWDNDNVIYLKEGDPEVFLDCLAREIASHLDPDRDPRPVASAYEEILRCESADEINQLCNRRGYRHLPSSVPRPTPRSRPGVSKPPPPPHGDGVTRPTPPSEPPVPPIEPITPAAKTRYWDIERLHPQPETPIAPSEAKPGMPGHRIAPSSTGGDTGGTKTPYGGADEDLETEAKAIQLVCSYEQTQGWTTDSNEGKGFVGYDIVATKSGETKYIEVKSSKRRSFYDMSWRQFEKARLEREHYYLYRVFNLEEADDYPEIIMVQDPWGYLEVETTSFKIVSIKDSSPTGSTRKVRFKLES